jgi:small subunit ribosomal protein S21
MVHVRDNEPLVKALRRFTKEVERSGVLPELREHRHYLSPGEKRRRKRKRAERQRLREAAKRKATN